MSLKPRINNYFKTKESYFKFIDIWKHSEKNDKILKDYILYCLLSGKYLLNSFTPCGEIKRTFHDKDYIYYKVTLVLLDLNVELLKLNNNDIIGKVKGFKKHSLHHLLIKYQIDINTLDINGLLRSIKQYIDSISTINSIVKDEIDKYIDYMEDEFTSGDCDCEK
jgi:hypothetical protein